jgi:hypothetical protein
MFRWRYSTAGQGSLIAKISCPSRTNSGQGAVVNFQLRPTMGV